MVECLSYKQAVIGSSPVMLNGSDEIGRRVAFKKLFSPENAGSSPANRKKRIAQWQSGDFQNR